jgi:hypothetical protein
VALDVPRAFVALATFMATFEPDKNHANDVWTHLCDEGQDIDSRAAKRLMRRYLERALYKAMHDDLHWLATHWFLEERGQKDEADSDKGGRP